jgi:ABC-2 type transport system ATP-binding protein
MSHQPLVAYHELSIRYAEVLAADSIDLEVMSGEMFGLIGPDGAGKTSLLRAALGLVAPSAGEVETCGLEPRQQRRRLAQEVGYLSQRFSLYGDLSVDENLAFFAAIHGVSDWRRRRDELLELVRLEPFRKRLADHLSGGMKQKLALACTLIHTPRLLVLDEPTTGVDPVSRRDFWQLLGRLRREGLTLVLTTPYLDEAERCQRVALMHRGSLLAVDEPEGLRRSIPGRVVEMVARPRAAAARRLRQHPAVTQVETFGERLHVVTEAASREEAEALAADLAAWLEQAEIQPSALRTLSPSLEDVFITLIRRAESDGGQEREVA